MANDIFGKNVVVSPGPLGRSETFEVYVGAIGSSGFLGLAQGVQNSYAQPLQRVYELGSYKAFMTSGRPQGSLSITRLVGKVNGGGPATLVDALKAVGNDPFFTVENSLGGTMVLREKLTGATWTASGCYVSQETTGVDANGVLVSEQIAIEYQKLEYKQNAPTPGNTNPSTP